MKAKQVYKKMQQKKMLKRIAPYVALSPDSYYGDNFRVIIQRPETDRVFLEVGEKCVIEGQFYFEKPTGSIVVGNRVHIGSSSFISINQIVIEDDVTIAWDCLLYDHNSHSVNWEDRKEDTIQEYKDIQAGLNSITNKNWSVVKSAPIHICNKAWIGTGVKILKGVTVGEGAVVAAGSVVTKDVEPWTVVGGNPAHLIKRLQKDNEQQEDY